MTQSKITDILTAVLNSVNKALFFERFYAVLYDNITGQLTVPVAARRDHDNLHVINTEQMAWSSREFRPDQYLPDGFFFRNKAVLGNNRAAAAIRDGLPPRYYSPFDDEPVGIRPEAWLSAPLAANERVFGAIVLERRDFARAFDVQNRDFLTALANRTAGAIHTLRLTERLRAVNEVGRTLSAGARLNEKAVLELIYQQADKLMDTRNMYIALYDASRQELRFSLALQDGVRVEHRPEWGPRSLEIAKGGLTEKVVRSKALLCPVNVAAWYREHNIEPKVEPIPKSWIGIPMVVEDRVIGVISLQNDEIEDVYGPDDQEVLQILASQAAAALANARLMERLLTVSEAGQILSSDVGLNEQRILELIYGQASRLMDTRNMYIALYDADRQELRFSLALQDGERVEHKPEWAPRPVEMAKGGLTEEVIRSKALLCPQDVAAWYKEHKIKPKVKPLPKSWLGMPMLVEGELIGVIALQNDRVAGLYTRNDTVLLQALANQAAIAVENARLVINLEERVIERTRQISSVQEISVIIASNTELDDVLSSIATEANNLMQAGFTTLFIYDWINLTFIKGIRKGKIQNTPSLPSKIGLASEIAITQKPLYVQNAIGYPQIKQVFVSEKQIKSFAAIPLVAKKQTVGVMFVNYLNPHIFSFDDMNALQLLANQAAVAIERAKLYESLNEKILELERAQSEIADNERILVITTLAADFAHRINNLAGTIPNWTALAKRMLDMSDERHQKIAFYLDRAAWDTKVLLQEARRLRDPLPDPETIDVKDLVDSVVSQIELLSSPNIQFVVESESDLAPIWAIKSQISDAIFNLLDNALKAIPNDSNDGKVTVYIGKDRDSNHKFIQLDISDNGIGIPTEKLEKIFEFGTTYRPSGEGIGYGLWRTRKIIEGLGGHITAYSTEGKGSTFSVVLPTMQSVQ